MLVLLERRFDHANELACRYFLGPDALHVTSGSVGRRAGPTLTREGVQQFVCKLGGDSLPNQAINRH